MQVSKKREDAIAAFDRVHKYEDFDTFRARFELRSQVSTYRHSGSIMDILFAPARKSARLAVFFNSQQKSGTVRPFTWQSVSKAFSAHRLFISDPTIYFDEELNLAWYAGNLGLNVQRHISELIAYFVDRTDADEIVFFGSSGGGFPALLYSQTFVNSLAFVLAPTATIRHHGNQSLVNNWLKHGYGLGPGEFDALPSDLVLDLPERINTGLSSPAVVLQNATDYGFMETQTAPLIRALGRPFEGASINVGDFHLALENYGEGHVMPPSARISRLASAISDIPVGGLHLTDYSELIKGTSSDA